MKVEKRLTNEEIARVFAMYLFSDIWFNWSFGKAHNGKNGKIVSVDSYTGELLVKLENNDTEITVIGSSKLLLTPLELISDEDAVEFGKIYGYRFDQGQYETALNKSKRLVSKFKELVIKTGYTIELYHYLIQQGYAVPLFFGVNHWANGKTAIELKIAIPNPSI